MSKRLQKAVQAVTDAREELHAAIREAVESGEKVTDVAKTTKYTRQRIYQIVGPKPKLEPSRKAMEARLAELDTRWELLVSELAEVERPPDAYIRRETAKRNGRRGKDARRGLPARATVAQETRSFAEAQLLNAIRKNPQDASVVILVRELDEANALRQSLEASYDSSLGITD